MSESVLYCRSYPMAVEVADHATVRDAVGFACLEYTRANRYWFTDTIMIRWL